MAVTDQERFISLEKRVAGLEGAVDLLMRGAVEAALPKDGGAWSLARQPWPCKACKHEVIADVTWIFCEGGTQKYCEYCKKGAPIK